MQHQNCRMKGMPQTLRYVTLPGVKGLVSGGVLQVLDHVGHEARLGETEAVVQRLQLPLAVLGGHHHGVAPVFRLIIMTNTIARVRACVCTQCGSTPAAINQIVDTATLTGCPETDSRQKIRLFRPCGALLALFSHVFLVWNIK